MSSSILAKMSIVENSEIMVPRIAEVDLSLSGVIQNQTIDDDHTLDAGSHREYSVIKLSSPGNRTLEMINHDLETDNFSQELGKIAHCEENVQVSTKEVTASASTDNTSVNDTDHQEMEVVSQETTNTKKDTDEFTKDLTVLEDVHKQCFSLSVHPAKRKGKTLQLKDEEFDNDVYVQNTTGFVTSRPVRWSIAVERYVEENSSIRCRWRYKRERNGEFSEAHLLLYFDTTRKVDLQINYSKGVLLVKGEAYKAWVTKEFPKIKRNFEELDNFPEENVVESSRKSSITKTSTFFSLNNLLC